MKSLLVLLSACIVCATPLSAQEPGEMGSLAILLGNQKVRETLGVSRSQAARLDAIRSTYRQEAREISATSPSTTAQRREAGAALDKLTAASNKKALSVLTPAQKSELLKLEHKFLGATLLYSKNWQNKVGITPEQARQIAEIRDAAKAANGKTNRLFELGKIGFFDRLEILREDRIQRGREILSLLNPEQKDAFAQLAG